MNREHTDQPGATEEDSREVGVCGSCGYDLRGLAEARCPECGSPFDREALRSRSVTWCKTAIRYLHAAAILQFAACAGLLLSPVGPAGVGVFVLLFPIGALLAGYGRAGILQWYVDLSRRIWPVEDIVDTYWRNISGVARSLLMAGVLFGLVVAMSVGMRSWFVFRGLVLAAGIVFAMFVVRRYWAGVRSNKVCGAPPGIARSLKRACVLNIFLMAASTFALVLIGSYWY